MTDSMDSPAAIMGRFTGGPLDGLSFSLPAKGGLRGAALVVLLADQSDQDKVSRYEYQLVPLGQTSEMQYRGEARAAAD